LNASTLSATPDPANDGHLALSISEGGSSISVDPGGEIGGLLQARDGALGTAVSSLDTLAFDVAGAINAVHQGGVDLAGNAGQPLFEVTSAAGAASQISVNAAISSNPDLLATRQAGGGTGDGSNVLAMIATESTTLSSGLGATDTLSRITSTFGTAAQTASASSDADQSMKSHLETLRQSASGVSSNDELVDMQKNQQAYAAMAKVITTTSAMLDSLLAIT
jgi:flagellar hook-associated protein 1 FlgK